MFRANHAKDTAKKAAFSMCVDVRKGTKEFNTCLCFQNIFWIGPKLNLVSPTHLFKSVMIAIWWVSCCTHADTMRLIWSVQAIIIHSPIQDPKHAFSA